MDPKKNAYYRELAMADFKIAEADRPVLLRGLYRLLDRYFSDFSGVQIDWLELPISPFYAGSPYPDPITVLYQSEEESAHLAVRYSQGDVEVDLDFCWVWSEDGHVAELNIQEGPRAAAESKLSRQPRPYGELIEQAARTVVYFETICRTVSRVVSVRLDHNAAALDALQKLFAETR